MTRTTSISVRIGVAILVAVWMTDTARAEDEPSTDPLVKSAELRAKKFASFEVVFKRTDFMPKGAISKLGSSPGAGRRNVPDQDTTHSSTGRLVVSGTKARYYAGTKVAR